jgi:RNA polymerase sigma-70 factor (ECF subfamily)
MSTSESTCWTMIRAAAAGGSSDRDELARHYLGAVHAYLSARWRGSALRDDLDDATQEVFVQCFRQGGAVEVPGPGWVPHFRAFRHAIIRNVARRFESRPVRLADSLPDIAADDSSQSRLFDRTWAQAIMAEVARLQRQRAAEGGAAVRVGVDDLPDTCPYDGCPRPLNGCHVIYYLG